MRDRIINRLALTNLAVNQFIIKNEIDPLKYNFNHFTNRFLSENNILITNEVPYIEEDFFLGVTVRSEYSTCIFINPAVFSLRQNFSTCHEVAHCMYNLNYNYKTQRFFNLDKKPHFYSDGELEQEILADASAGVIMLPDIAIVKYLETTKSFCLIAEELQMSKAALYTRLVQFLEMRAGIESVHAADLIRRFQDSGDRYFINSAISSWGRTIKKEIIYEYENCI